MDIETREQLFELIKDETSKAAGGLDGAFLSSLLYHKYGNPLAKLEFKKLSHAIQEAEEAGYIRRDGKVKHLRILPFDSDKQSRSPTENNIYIRKEFWHAMFLNRDETVSYRYDKTLNKLVEQSASSQVKRHEVPLEPVSRETQKQWLGEFLDRDQISLPCSLEDLLPNADTLGPYYSRRWKHDRTNRAVKTLSDWAKQHGLDTSNIFQSVASLSVVSGRVQSDDNIDALRESIIAAISKMDDVQLQEISKAVVMCLHGNGTNS